ncbi:MAG TPA: ergothioneine biosynthesis protein EgtC [Frankiaceae bacterium]
MCRHVGYLGEPIALGALVYEPASGLERQSWAPRLQEHGTVNADGFGVGWYVPGRATPARYRRAVPLWADANLRSIAPTIASGCIVAAVRSATIGMPIEETATAPFQLGDVLFSHNGLVDPDALRHLLMLEGPDAVLPDSPCDSAQVAALLGTRVHDGVPLLAAVASLVADIAAIAPTARLNLLAASGSELVATRWGDTLWNLATPTGVTLASEPLDDRPGWAEIPDRTLAHVLTVGATHTLALHPLPDPLAPAGQESP